MFGIENLELFLLATMVFIITPGMDTLFVLNKSMGEGQRAGMFAAIGVNAGILVHTLFAALGLSLIIAQSALAFSILKYCGAVYLIYLGIKAMLSKDKGMPWNQDIQLQTGAWQNFKAGLITNVLNPKVALFFLSFFPQFVKKDLISSYMPFLTLGMCYAVLGLIWYGTLVYFVSLFSSKLKANPKFSTYLNRFSGIVFVFMGLKVAFSRR